MPRLPFNPFPILAPSIHLEAYGPGVAFPTRIRFQELVRIDFPSRKRGQFDRVDRSIRNFASACDLSASTHEARVLVQSVCATGQRRYFSDP